MKKLVKLGDEMLASPFAYQVCLKLNQRKLPNNSLSIVPNSQKVYLKII